jgi:uncharacterized protein YeaO (DUF488 family)
MADPADTIREALESAKADYVRRRWKHTRWDAALAALTELEQQAAEATRKYDAMDSRYHDLWHDETDRAEAAEADRDRLQREVKLLTDTEDSRILELESDRDRLQALLDKHGIKP